MRISSGSLVLSIVLMLVPVGALADHRLPDERPSTSFEDYRRQVQEQVAPWVDDPMLELRQPHGGFLAHGLADELGHVVPLDCYRASYGAYWGLVPMLLAVSQASDVATLDLERGRFREELARAFGLTEDDAERCASVVGAADEAEDAGPATVAADAIVELQATPALMFIGPDGEQVSDIAVEPGETMLIRVDNTAGFEHSFWIGTEQQLEQPLSTTGVGIPSWTSGTRESVWDVPGDVSGLMFGCTVPGHFSTMHGTIVVGASD